MSLQRRIVLPPLALGVHPAPPPKKVDKDDKKKSESKDKAKDGGKDERQKDEKGEEDKKDDKAGADKRDDKDKKDDKEKLDDKDKKGNKQLVDSPKVAAPDRPAGEKAPDASPDTAAAVPDSPASMIPEPGTPRSDDPPTPTPDTAVKPETEITHVPGPKPAQEDKKEEEDKPPEPLPPIRLVGPAPPRPLRTALELNPAAPYPPINTDPRGAYYKYAKYNQGQMLYLDVTKDGWLSEQWRDKPEREALAMLRGESEVAAMREAERVRALAEVRKVPAKAEEILLQLWNDLVEAVNHECTVEDFWSRYDWSDPAAQPHLLPAKKPAKEEVAKEAAAKEPESEQPYAAETTKDSSEADNETVDDLEGVEWTKEGLEEILGTAGVMCLYNTPKPLSRSFYEPSAGYLVLGHGFFMLRTEDYLQWKSEEAANKFEMLVTSGHDRVFGEMVKAQQAEERKKKDKEYKERKLAEKRAAEKEAKEKKARREENKQDDKKGEKKDDKNDNEKEEKEEAKKENKTMDGKEDKKENRNADDKRGKKEDSEVGAKPEGHKEDAGKPRRDDKAPDGKVAQDQPQAIVAKGEKLVVAVPVKEMDAERKDDAVKHEIEPIAAAPGEAIKPDAPEKAKTLAAGEKDHGVAKPGDKAADAPKQDGAKAKPDAKAKKIQDAVREAQLLAKMVAAGETPPGVSMEDIALAFKALELAAGADEKIVQVPLIWTWHDPCERWRWRNYEAGLHEVGPGGWEERDWRVFADDRGCDDYDLEESWAEADERDVHDWSL